MKIFSFKIFIFVFILICSCNRENSDIDLADDWVGNYEGTGEGWLTDLTTYEFIDEYSGKVVVNIESNRVNTISVEIIFLDNIGDYLSPKFEGGGIPFKEGLFQYEKMDTNGNKTHISITNYNEDLKFGTVVNYKDSMQLWLNFEVH